MDPMARGAADAYRTPQPIIETFTFDNERVNRYVWYPGEDLPWPEIKGGWIKRCRVTPILPFLTWERINDVPQDMRLAVRRDWMDRDHQEAQYEIRPQGIFDSVMNQYGQLGVKELTTLGGMKPQDVEGLRIDDIFCPWPESRMPKPYREIEEQIQKSIRDLGGNQFLCRVGEEMLESIAASKAYDQTFVDAEESQKELKYTRPGLRALSRLDRRRRDTALNDMAAAQNKVFDKVPEILAGQSDANPVLVDLVKEMQQQGARQQQQIELLTQLLAEKKSAKTLRKRSRQPEPTNA